MKPVLWNVLLALFWAVATGAFTFTNLLLGFGVGLMILAAAQRAGGPENYLAACWRWIDLAAFFIWELFVANLRVAYDVLTPGHQMRAGVVAVPLDARTNAEIVVLTSLISLTPGTLCLDISSDRKELFIHSMYIDEVDAFRRSIKEGLERRVLRAMQ